jgi:outer membrane receptor for Fe3+-dicitrate
MKMTFLTATLILAFASSSALASDKETKDAKDTKASATAAKEKAKPTEVPRREVVLTGSNIKRAVRKDGQVTDGPNSLTIIDRKAIERSGAVDVRQVLARQSAFR